SKGMRFSTVHLWLGRARTGVCRRRAEPRAASSPRTVGVGATAGGQVPCGAVVFAPAPQEPGQRSRSQALTLTPQARLRRATRGGVVVVALAQREGAVDGPVGADVALRVLEVEQLVLPRRRRAGAEARPPVLARRERVLPAFLAVERQHVVGARLLVVGPGG